MPPPFSARNFEIRVENMRGQGDRWSELFPRVNFTHWGDWRGMWFFIRLWPLGGTNAPAVPDAGRPVRIEAGPDRLPGIESKRILQDRSLFVTLATEQK